VAKLMVVTGIFFTISIAFAGHDILCRLRKQGLALNLISGESRVFLQPRRKMHRPAQRDYEYILGRNQSVSRIIKAINPILQTAPLHQVFLNLTTRNCLARDKELPRDITRNFIGEIHSISVR